MFELLERRAAVEPRSVNVEARTAEVVWSTGAIVQRRDFEGPFGEALSLDRNHVRLDRLRGANLLDAHRQSEVRNVLGVVVEAKTNGKQGTATIQFSGRPDVDPIFDDVRAGVIRHVSVGYTVAAWQERRDPKTGHRTRTAIDWTPHEISLVPIAADPAATVRSKPMDPTTDAATPGTEPAPAAPNPPADAAPGAAPVQRAGIEGEVRSIASIAGLDDSFVRSQVAANATADQARRAAFEELARRAGPEISTQAVPQVVMGTDYTDPQTRAAQIGEALYARIAIGHELSAPARQYAYITLPDVAREILRAHGIQSAGLAPNAVVTRALHTTSDFALILGDTVGRTLRAAYEAAPAGVKSLARQTTAKDFRAKHRLMLGEAPTLEKVNEHGEFKSGTMAEADETYALGTYGRIFGITRKAIVNDDMGAFSDLSGRLGVAAAEFEAQFLVDLLTKNAGAGPTMADTKALFHADHGNLAAAGAAPSEATLSAGRLAMRGQTGLSGKPINVTPKSLLVPAALETAGEKQLAVIQPAKSADVNPMGGKLDLVVDSRLDAVSATRWYVVADAAQIDGLEYCYLESEPGPQIESQNGFRVDGVEVKVRLDFGAGFVEHRAWYANDGA